MPSAPGVGADGRVGAAPDEIVTGRRSMKASTLDSMRTARAAKRPFALATTLASGAQAVIEPGAGDVEPELAAVVADVLRSDRSRIAEIAGERLFVHAFNPPLRLFVIGAVHIAQALAPIAMVLGYDVTVVDPRTAFATVDRFPGVTLSHEWPDDALLDAAPDARSAVITLTHDPKLDDAALTVALATPAFYIGCLGSKRTHAARLERLAEKGFDAATRARIHGPLGLDIGARTPAEIAAAAIAQTTAVLRRGGAA